LRDPDKREVAWIKRSGAWLEKAKPSDFLRVNISHPDPKIASKISKEINLHLGCLKTRPDINAVIHTHPAMVTGLATAGVDLGRKMTKIKPKIGSKIEIIKYYKPGSIALAKAVKKAIKKANAVAMANHGLVVVGKSLKEAYQRTLIIEKEAERLIKGI
jgi:L-fuculose-phosphate aldolase